MAQASAAAAVPGTTQCMLLYAAKAVQHALCVVQQALGAVSAGHTCQAAALTDQRHGQ
jgi:hypothetical protein